jgi:AcrR family transcriptional regulator
MMASIAARSERSTARASRVVPRAAASPRAAALAPRRTHAERREEAERRLLEAALEIVARRGTVRMTLAEVGVAAGYSRGLSAHRFGSKAGLLRALAAYIGERFGAQRKAGPPREPGLDAILGNIHFYFSRKGPDWSATRALIVMMTEAMMEPSLLRRDMVAYNRAALKWFEHHLNEAVRRGETTRDIDAAATAVIILGAMRGVMLQYLADDRIPLHEVRDRMLAIVQRALARR